MANTRIKDLTNTATTVPSDAYVAIDGSANGTAKIGRDDLRQDTADAIAAAPSTYNLAPLTSGSVDVDKGGTGSTTVDGAKTTLEIPNVGTAANEVSVNGMLGDLAFQSSAAVTVDDLTVDGELIAAVGKPMPVNGPSMRFDGASYVSFADNDAFSFTNGTDDTPFTVTGWVKMEDATRFCIAGKWDGSDEWLLYVTANDYLQLAARDSGSDITNITSNSTVTPYEGQWIHVAATYGGAGPNSDSPFSANMSSGNAALYINGKVVSSTAADNASYGGMSNLGGVVRLGRYSTNYTKGEIRDVKLYNKELSAAEVKEVYSNGQLPNSFSESTGAIAYVSDFSSGADGFVTYGGTGVGNIDGIGGKNDNLRFTVDSASANHQFQKVYGSLIEDGKSVRVSAEIYIPSSNTQITGVQVNSDGTANVDVIDTATATNAWTTVSGVFTKDYPEIRFRALAGTAAVFVGNGSDVFYVRNVRITQIGSVLDARAEQFDTSTGKLYDLSGNDFVGTQSGGVSLLGREFPVYETGTWNGVYSPYTGSFATMTMDTSLVYTRIGNLVTVTGFLQTDNVDTTGGSGQLQITGLPFAASVVSTCHIGFAFSWGSATPLTGAVIGSAIRLYTRASTTGNTNTFDVSNLSAGALANRNTIYISATYQIS